MDDRNWAITDSTSSTSSSEALATINRLSKLTEELSADNRKKAAEILGLHATNAAQAEQIHQLNRRLSEKSGHSKIDPTVSKIVKEIYITLNENGKFKLEESFTSEHNRRVKERIMAIIRDTEGFEEQPSSSINLAIRGRYTVEKKNQHYNDSAVKTAKRLTARRHSIFNTRKRISRDKHIHTEIMTQATAADMSDLVSDDDNPDHLIVKRPAWREETFTAAMVELDSHSTHKRQRLIGTPSKRQQAK